MKCMESGGSPCRAMSWPARLYFLSRTMLRQLVRVLRAAECVRQPSFQRSTFAVVGLMRLDDRLLAGLQRVIEARRHNTVSLIESFSMKPPPLLRSEVDQHKPSPGLRGRFLDLREVMHGRGVNAGDQTKIEQQEAALRPARGQRLDLLIEPASRTEEQIALQGYPLKLTAVRCQKRKLDRASIDRAAIVLNGKH